jgi:uncharacterized protein YidB (DUF937 family)
MTRTKLVSILVLACLIAGAVPAGSAFAGVPSQGDAPPALWEKLRQALAGALGTSPEELDAAFKTAVDQAVGELAAEGWLTQQQADRLRERLGDRALAGAGGGPQGLRSRLACRLLFGRNENSLFGAAAGTLGLSRSELFKELKAAKSIAQVARDKGVDPQEVVDSFAARISERLSKWVSAGRLTQKQADVIVSRASADAQELVNKPLPWDGQAVSCRAPVRRGFLRQGSRTGPLWFGKQPEGSGD